MWDMFLPRPLFNFTDRLLRIVHKLHERHLGQVPAPSDKVSALQTYSLNLGRATGTFHSVFGKLMIVGSFPTVGTVLAAIRHSKKTILQSKQHAGPQHGVL